MCETKNRDALRNGNKGDLGTIGLATADVIDALIGVQAQLKEIPTRNEVRDMIHSSLQIHVESCDAARDGKPAEANKFKFGGGKFGIEAEGRMGVLFGAVLGAVAAVLLIKVAPYVGSWLMAFFQK